MKIIDVEPNTPEWLAERFGLPTASKASSLITPTGRASAGIEDYALELALEVYDPDLSEGFKGNYHTDRGHKLEPIAAVNYALTFDCDPIIAGFCLSDDGKSGMSPDRLLGPNGILEIKCLSKKEHVKAMLHVSETKRPPPTFLAQTQFQLMVSRRDYVDLYFYHPNLPEFFIRVLPIKPHIEMLECQVDDVIAERDRIVELLRAA